MQQPSIPVQDWHAQPPERVLGLLKSSANGLEADEAKRRLDLFGPNRLAKARREGPLRRFIKQLDNILIYVLLASSVGTAALQNWLDTGVILGVVVINALIGYLQEGKAEQALDSIAKMMSQSALALRNGRLENIDAGLVVPGDILHLKAGDRVPADMRFLKTTALQIEEAALTGESVPVDKGVEAVLPDTPLAERASMAYGGTLVTHGQGVGLVVATGQGTEMGRIGTLLASVERLATPLLRRIESFGRWLAFAILILAGGSFLLGWLGRGLALEESFMAAVGLAVAAIPEGLPAVLTIALAIGVRRMAARKALIRHLPAVETLGSVTVICSDKTGTLTQNKMTVAAVLPTPSGKQALLEAAVLCNDAQARRQDGLLVIEGSPTETALLRAAANEGVDIDKIRQSLPRISEVPFDSTVKRMLTLNRQDETAARLFIKGAPESVLALCDPARRREWEALARQQAAQGQRVLAFASRNVPFRAEPEPSARDMDFLGFITLIDPPRPEAIDAVAACHQAGVSVCMITGDHAETARAIGAELGLDTKHPVLTGSRIDELDDRDLAKALSLTRIVARATPEHKLRLVGALQSLGEVVAMTGDGVNDAPALKKADIGVAMGQGGTEAAKEAAMMVLADDNFATIAHAVSEGRGVYDNLKKSIAYILPTNMAQAFVIVAAVTAGMHLPITPVQILWVNMVTAVTLAMALAFEPPESDVMRRAPRSPAESLITPFQLWRLLLVTLLVVIATFGLFLYALEQGASMDEARTVAVNTLVGCEIAYLFNMRYLNAPAWGLKALLGSRPVLLSVLVMAVFQAAFTYAPFMQAFFATSAIPAGYWGLIALCGLALFVLIEIEKVVLNAFFLKPARPGKRPKSGRP
ncbi:MAG: HAD-IC family P-type ATPase [Rhodospirillales bacterium]|nr:HAD-IC family P-type ATPase [Rhodospirillales bacterium]